MEPCAVFLKFSTSDGEGGLASRFREFGEDQGDHEMEKPGAEHDPVEGPATFYMGELDQPGDEQRPREECCDGGSPQANQAARSFPKGILGLEVDQREARGYQRVDSIMPIRSRRLPARRRSERRGGHI